MWVFSLTVFLFTSNSLRNEQAALLGTASRVRQGSTVVWFTWSLEKYKIPTGTGAIYGVILGSMFYLIGEAL